MDSKQFFETVVKGFLLLMAASGLTYYTGLTNTVHMMTGAGSFPTANVTVVPFPFNQERTTFYDAACDIQVLTNQNKSINSVGFVISATPVADPTALSYLNGTVNAADYSRWTYGGLQSSSYYCYVKVVQNEGPTSTSNWYLNFTRLGVPSAVFSGDTVWASGTITTGTYTYNSLIINGPITISGNVTVNALENISISSPSGAITIQSDINSSVPYTLTFNTRDFTDQGTIVGTGGAASHGTINGCGNPCMYNSYPQHTTNGAPGAKVVISAKTITFGPGGSINLNAGAGDDATASCCPTGSAASTCGATNGGMGGTLVLNSTKPVVNVSAISITLNGGRAGNAAACVATGSGSGATCAIAGAAGTGGALIINGLNYTTSGTVNVFGGKGGDSACFLFECCAGSNGAAGGASNLTISSNISVSNIHSATGGLGGAACSSTFCSEPAGSTGANGAWNITYCSNNTGWGNFVPTPSLSAMTCLAPPTTSFLTPNATTSLLTLSNNLTINISTDASVLNYRFQLSLNNGTTWTDMNAPTTVAPSDANTTFTFDVYLMNATTTALVRVMPYNTSSKIFGGWIYSSPFYLLNRNTSINVTTSPVPISSVPFTVYCNYTSNSTTLQDAAVFVYIDGTQYPTTYDFATTHLYSYTWPANQTILSGSHTYSCWASKGNFNTSQSSAASFSIGGFVVFYTGNETRLFCPFPTYFGVYPAYQTAGKGAVRVQNFNTTVNGNYFAILQTPQPAGMILYGRCDKLSPSTSGWTVLTDTAGFPCWNNINSTNITAFMWVKGDCIGAVPGTYAVPVITVYQH